MRTHPRTAIQGFLLVVIGACGTSARADLFPFARITSNSAEDVAGQLLMEVTEFESTKVKFRFTNDATDAIRSSITRVYFDDGDLLGIEDIVTSDGVSYSKGASPGNLPGGNVLDPPFVASVGFFSGDADPPVYPNGVNESDEWLEIIFELVGGGTFQTVLSQLGDGTLRVGIHVQGIGVDEDSDSFLAIPAPGSVLLASIGLGAIGAIRRRYC